MLYFLNNCRNVEHAKLYGSDAFFDLYTSAREDAWAKELRAGDLCWVASHSALTKAGKSQVVMAKCAFSRARHAPNPEAPGETVWVLEGSLVERDVLPKSEAATHRVYSRFFNKRGHFKQVSVLRGA